MTTLRAIMLCVETPLEILRRFLTGFFQALRSFDEKMRRQKRVAKLAL